MHETTHSLFGAAVGRSGGTWLQEGIAEYVSELWMKRSASARVFHTLPAEPRGYLRGLMLRHGPTNPDGVLALKDYFAAGSFIEFLVRGRPAANGLADLRALAKLSRRPSEDRMLKVEKILGKPIREIEDEWKSWVKKRRSD